MPGQLSFSINKRIGFSKTALSQISEIIDGELLKAAEILQRTSPVATGKLKESWDVVPTRAKPNTSLIEGTVTNDASNSLFRVRGRNKGRQPPTSAIAAWLTAVGGDPKLAFVIARSIGKKGTRRYREKKNNAGVDLNGKPLPNSPIARAEKTISQKLKNLKF